MDTPEMLQDRSASKSPPKGSPLCEECVDEQVQESTKEFIPHQDCSIQVTQDDGAGVLPSIRPVSSGSNDYSSQVQGHDEDEELAVGIEPYLPQDPFANLPFGRFGFVTLGKDNREASCWRGRRQSLLFFVGNGGGLDW